MGFQRISSRGNFWSFSGVFLPNILCSWYYKILLNQNFWSCFIIYWGKLSPALVSCDALEPSKLNYFTLISCLKLILPDFIFIFLLSILGIIMMIFNSSFLVLLCFLQDDFKFFILVFCYTQPSLFYPLWLWLHSPAAKKKKIFSLYESNELMTNKGKIDLDESGVIGISIQKNMSGMEFSPEVQNKTLIL